MDASFNAESRTIIAEIDIWSTESSPITVTRDNVLVDFDLLEEASADSKNVFGAISANEFSFSLYNEGNQYSPQGRNIRRGVKVQPRLAVQGHDWIGLGDFYISNATTSVDGSVVNVTATDCLENVFNTELRDSEALIEVPYSTVYTTLLSKLGVPHKVSDELNEVLKYGFLHDKPGETLQELTIGAMALCNVNRLGEVEVSPLYGSRELRATLTDNDQIISIPTSISNVRSFDSVSLTYYNAQLTDQEEILRVKDFEIPPGVFKSNEIQFSQFPVAILSGVGLRSEDPVELTSYKYSAHAIQIETTNQTGRDLPVEISAYGKYIDFIPTVRTSDGAEQYKIDNKFIQSEAYAEKVYSLMERYANSYMPYLDLEVRGNPSLLIGDKIRVESQRFGIDFTGILYRAKYTYDGGLKCSMTLLDSSILDV